MHLGSYWAEHVGPSIEPALSPRQAAVQGGGCTDHIRQDFEHLESPVGGPVLSEIQESLWNDVMGPAGP
eukprot:6335401-Lingulodinium_polyedra.AAC.1